MFTATTTISVLLLLALVLVLVLAVAWRRSCARLGDALRQKAEIGNFFDLFSRSLRNDDELFQAMNQAARYIAESIVARGVCIYRLSGETLEVAGFSGEYTLSARTIDLRGASEEEFGRALHGERIALGQGFLGRVGRQRTSCFIVDAVHDERLNEFPMEKLPDQVMVVPICRNNEFTGIVVAITDGVWSRFTMEKLAQLQFAAAQVRLMQELEDSYMARSEQQRLNQELDFARQLQGALLPPAVPSWGEFEVHASTNSAKEVNGDFYDFVEIDDQRLLVVMGDACGKGVPACLLASMARSFIRAAAEHFTTLEALLREVNANLFRDTDAERFVTLGCCLLDSRDMILEYGRAGHTELIYFIRDHIRRVYPDGAGLGILPDELSGFDTISIEMVPGMSVLLYSDGITEALDGAGDEFGVDRLANKFEQCCADHLATDAALDDMLRTVSDFEPEQHDDRTMIIIHRHDRQG